MYQYFPNREWLVGRVLAPHQEKLRAVITEHPLTLQDATLPRAAKTLVRAMLDAHRVEPKLHRVLMEQADNLPPHDVYFVNADDTTALEPSVALIERFRPDLLPLVGGLDGNASLITCRKLKDATGWRHATSWREYL